MDKSLSFPDLSTILFGLGIIVASVFIYFLAILIASVIGELLRGLFGTRDDE